jgi:hypothetical protein
MKNAELRKKLEDHGYRNETIDKLIELKLLLQEEDAPPEPKTTVATFILPPETSIDVQSTHITNLSNIELEIDLRINSKIKEIAIKV